MPKDLGFLKDVDPKAPFCITGKIPHRTIEIARRVMADSIEAYRESGEINGRKMPQRVYRCDDCGWFHLTHRKKR